MNGPSARSRRRWRDVDGIVLLDKPEGLSSNAALQRVRRAFRARKAGPHRQPRSARERLAADLPRPGHQGERHCCSMPTRPIAFASRSAAARRPATAKARRSRRAPVPALDEASVRAGRSAFLGRIDAGAADVFGAEARGPAPVSAGARRHRGRAGAAPRAHRAPRTARHRVPTGSSSRSPAARALMSAASPRTSRAPSGRSAMSQACAASALGPFTGSRDAHARRDRGGCGRR